MVRNEHSTPVIIKYPFRQMTGQNQNATYARINYGEHIEKQSICIDDGIGRGLKELK